MVVSMMRNFCRKFCQMTMQVFVAPITWIISLIRYAKGEHLPDNSNALLV